MRQLTMSSLAGVHRYAQLKLYTVVNRKPVEMSEGGSDVIARFQVHYEASSCDDNNIVRVVVGL